MSTSAVSRFAPALVGAVVLVGAWQAYVSVSHIKPQILPSPWRVATQGWSHRDVIGTNAVATLQVTLVGFAFSLIVAWTLAVAVDFSGWLRRALLPMFVTSQTIPIIVLAPMMITWFGFGLLPKVLLVALVTFFPLAIGLIEGFAATEREAGALLQSMGASRWKQFRYVRLPTALPRFFTALRIGVTYAVVGAIFAEYAGAENGLGIYMARQKQMFRTDLVLAAVVVTAVISILLFVATYAVERVVAPWARQERQKR
ncbi:ABC transporter permease [Antrihabitans stalactiti]|uniref:ABC transporter permease n=1 Tax=Antrihabitans stalactiti TaxID=2584121 RepID=A0A848KTG7_9NOCA|nr:ABC transporter permease [Antrihabitans stalactiti]NMN98847.1 ABC transporter permease [Antrihabitans stalactiti]